MALDPLYSAFAAEAALSAGRIHRAFFRQNPDVRKKGPIDLVTAADVAAERDFRARVASAFPDHAVLGEEATGPAPDRLSRWRWIIDPLDGTTNFAHELAIFSVSIALEVDGVVEIGVVYDPIGEELFAAERGGGARLNGRRLCVSSRAALEDALLCTGFPYSIREDRQRQVEVFAAFLTRARAVRRLGSAALDLCYVAAGRFDGFWEQQLHVWDMAAAALILDEAGGRATTYEEGALDLTVGGSIVASNGALHRAMVEIIRQARA